MGVTQRLRRSIIGEMILFTLGNLGPDAMSGSVDKKSPWLTRLRSTVDAAVAATDVGKSGSDLILVARVVLSVNDGQFADAKAILAGNAFPLLAGPATSWQTCGRLLSKEKQ